MGHRWETGRRAFGAWLGRSIVAALAAAVVAWPAAGGRASPPLRPLDGHATVLNGAVVGSAFAIADGIAVTNRHVVAGLQPGDAVVFIASRPGGARAEARLLAVSPRMDLAVLHIPSGLVPVVDTAAAPATAGLVVEAAGIDAGEGGDGSLLQAAGIVLDPVETIGAFGPGLIARLPGARPGFSGAALLDTGGHLVGMVTALRSVETVDIVPTAGVRARRGRPTVEAFALRAAAIRAEVRRLLGSTGT